MLQQFNDYIEKENICGKDDKILLAVSGGMDSMVMCDLFIKSGYRNLFIAHCNFRLRGEESAMDESFVRSYARQSGMPFYCSRFDTASYADRNRISIQMAARELRYNWFNELLEEKQLNLIATAHHADDNIETFFINLLRGTGISGLKGISARKGHLIRPLLFAGREEIDAYSKEHQIQYRQDSSNASEKYLRNKIRLKLLPLLYEIDPSYRNSLKNTIENIADAEKLYRQLLERFSQTLLTKDEQNNIYIPIDKLLVQQDMDVLLFELLSPYGFTAKQSNDLIAALDGIPGKVFYSETHQLLIDRDFLLITEQKASSGDSYLINIEDREIKQPVHLQVHQREIDQEFNIPKEKNIACLDFNLLEFPLVITRWKDGDSFQPLGMKGRKKVSDFFIDEKLNRFQKEETYILRSAGKIVWIIGHRIDERYKISSSTKKACILKFNR